MHERLTVIASAIEIINIGLIKRLNKAHVSRHEQAATRGQQVRYKGRRQR